jgi:hypothetical protein
VKLGATSWQVPGTYLDNARLLAGHADFAELLVYTWNDELRQTLAREWTEMRGLLEVSVHLPADTMKHAAAALEFFSGRGVLRYTAHPVGDVTALRDFLQSGVELVGQRLCLENLENDVFDAVMPVVADIPFSVTLDYGHLLFMGAAAAPVLDRYSRRWQRTTSGRDLSASAPRVLHLSSCSTEACLDKCPVSAVRVSHQYLMCPLFDKAAVFEVVDDVGVLDRGQSMGDD